jgi:hypothetical protein
MAGSVVVVVVLVVLPSGARPAPGVATFSGTVLRILGGVTAWPLLPLPVKLRSVLYNKPRCERPKKGHEKIFAGKNTPLALHGVTLRYALRA